ncbi:hypothetical protein C2S52_017813 [Perilla frutescens var. hirtella]|nr:hypothetical protein C2S52_017813 [Perilla frutescens var. hirtella]
MPKFTDSEKNQALEYLLDCSCDGKLARGKINEVAAKFQVSRHTIWRLWAEAKKKRENNEPMHIQPKPIFQRKKRVTLDLDRVSRLPLKKRSSIRTLAKGIDCKKSTVGRWIKQGLIRAHTSAIRPDLTTSNKLLRLRFTLEALELDRNANMLTFKSMYNTVHIDEKWFYMKKETHRFYLTPEEAEPHRSCKSKKFISKIMFMCAVSRPLLAVDGSVLFDGKIGVFPFTHKVPAKRASKNRSRGTLETKPIKSITQEVIRDCLINQVLPAIKLKWPAEASKVIYIQQDNAKPHIKDSDINFREALQSIQSLQTEMETNNVDELVNAVVTSFENLCPTKLNKIFLTLQSFMLEIMKVKGHNACKIPHMGKNALSRQVILPLNLDVPPELVRQSIDHLIEAGVGTDIEELKNSLSVDRLEGN